jgi:hypothetical protein
VRKLRKRIGIKGLHYGRFFGYDFLEGCCSQAWEAFTDCGLRAGAPFTGPRKAQRRR